MKKLFLILIVCFLMFLPAAVLASPFLACDIPTEEWQRSDVEIDGVIVEGLFQVSSDGTALLLLDLEGMAPGPHTFRARFVDTPTWPGPGEWSLPFDATKPGGVPGGVRVIKN